jgi:hypothetical protein
MRGMFGKSNIDRKASHRTKDWDAREDSFRTKTRKKGKRHCRKAARIALFNMAIQGEDYDDGKR